MIVNTEHKQAISSAEKNAKNLPATSVEIEDGVIRNIGDAAVFNLEVHATGYCFYREGKGYLCATKTDANELTYYTPIAPNDYCKCSIGFEADNTASITFNLPTSGRNKLRYNPDNALFNCYTSGQAPVSLFRYTSGDPTKESQTLQFSESFISIFLGDTFTTPTLSGAKTDINYTSSNTEVATINAQTGEVGIRAAGSTTITATAISNNYYNTGSASYTLLVKLPEELFDFTTPESYGFSTPNTESRETIVDKDFKQGFVIISVTHGATTDTRFYNSVSDGIYLGVYTHGGSITFSVPDGYHLESIDFNTVSSTDQKGLPNVKNKRWSGNAQTATFTVTETVRLKSVKVNYQRNTGATNIVSTQQAKSPITIYSINGQRVSSKSTTNLPQGIYIINGKKCVVR